MKSMNNGVGWQGKEMEQECAEYSEGALSKLTVYKQSLDNFSLKKTFMPQ